MTLREKMLAALADPSIGAVDMPVTDAIEMGQAAPDSDAERVVVPRAVVEKWLDAESNLD